ncbi:sugar kinase [Neobacillus terrae]|uniref:sugar kinase n=1 Tax=Neobacillus terrae TaxID=3034837 RepID=UPI00140E382A|nr:sugar kinase [Neobacillus terrae]NHM32289.1 sugar kinase [Neobacillus terrae]
MKKIVTLGEIMLRLSTNHGERLFQSDQLSLHYGGAEANVAVALANFGYEAYFVGKVPNNPLGLAAERHLRSFGVNTGYLLKGGERLGTYYLETGAGARSAQVTYDRKHSSFSQLTVDEVSFAEIFQGAELFHVTGITPALSNPLKEVTLLALMKAKELGVTTSFDFNYRSKLWNQKEAAEAITPFLPYVDICSCGGLDALYLLNIQKADHTFNKEQQLMYYYEKIAEMYPNIKYLYSTFRNVISASNNTLQGNLFLNGTLYQSKEHNIDHIVDRVGGGDAFAAGILYGIIEKMPPQQVITFATAASVLKHTVNGDCSTFSKDEIMAFAESEPGKIVR